MRILVDLPESQIRDLDAFADEQGMSRTELVRRAIAFFTAEKRAPLSEYFGLWTGDFKESAVDYQRRMRAEW